MKAGIAASTVVLAALAATAQTEAATPPKQRPLTEHWSCENGRTVDINYHPRRERVPAWITYLGNRVEVSRKRAPDGNTFVSKDGKVSWTEDDGVGTLQYEGLLDPPVACRKTNKQREG
jgi:hypothetical protein